MRRALARLARWYLLRYADQQTQHQILNDCVRKHFNTVSENDILKGNPDGTIQFGDEKFDGTLIKELKNQAKFLEELFLWKVLKKDVLYNINQKMMDGGAVIQDLISAKIGLWLFSEVIEKRLKRLRGN